MKKLYEVTYKVTTYAWADSDRDAVGVATGAFNLENKPCDIGEAREVQRFDDVNWDADESSPVYEEEGSLPSGAYPWPNGRDLSDVWPGGIPTQEERDAFKKAKTPRDAEGHLQVWRSE